MTSLWAALDRLQWIWEDGSDSRVPERVSKAFSNWTHRAEHDLKVVKPLRSYPPEMARESEASTPPVSPASAVWVQEPRSALEPSESKAAGYQQEPCNPDWPGDRVGLDSHFPQADYYEILQISRAAESETIHRVYRIMAARFHPDNAITGDMEKFLALREAYQVLSKPELRAEYDRNLALRADGPPAAFGQKGFVGGLKTERSRRLGLLSLLYDRRRMNEERPGLSMLNLERLMCLPREYLQFALWYLKSKGYITVGENSDYCVTAPGVDYLEEQSGKNKLMRELLTGESERVAPLRITDSLQPEEIACTATLPVGRVRKGRAARRTRKALARRAGSAA